MKKILLLTTLILLIQIAASAQLEIAKMVGKDKDRYNVGFGAFLKFGYPVSKAADLSMEVGGLYFTEKVSSAYRIGLVPVKIGYRYTFNGTGKGLYGEPQVGYNLYGIKSDHGTDRILDQNFNGFILSFGIGYLLPPGASLQFDLGLRFETIMYNSNSENYVGLRLTHNFSFKRRDSKK